jgi:hypothetical protein
MKFPLFLRDVSDTVTEIVLNACNYVALIFHMYRY